MPVEAIKRGTNSAKRFRSPFVTNPRLAKLGRLLAPIGTALLFNVVVLFSGLVKADVVRTLYNFVLALSPFAALWFRRRNKFVSQVSLWILPTFLLLMAIFAPATLVYGFFFLKYLFIDLPFIHIPRQLGA